MSKVTESIANLPPSVKIGGAVVLVAGFGAALALFGGTKAIYVVLAGMVAIGLLLLAYQAILGVMARRKAAPMERAIAGNAATAPTGITEPARRARLDDLRKNFEGGVDKFRSAGKNLYALPWYLLVGEPGSGKTEAVRHCNVGFPPGLQDQLQGVGGTLNMNWWFTNYAIILDTAGRLMFEEVEPGSTSEWQEFLKLLKRNRPNCPVNGLLLVIPAESLIRDTSESIEHKGGKIAQQLDNIQRVLGVRFPVFVIITKCDLINGFREFFDEIADPALQHQILGWSNPNPLDTPFNPEQVEQHLKTVQTRLTRRRLGLMLDPVNTEDPRAKRTEQVDALYAFPDSMIKIAPRLKRYLEMIFVAGEWASKPLFLRGIYFTSSMREGSALDAELAEALGVPIETLPEGRVWERDRAYFLRDLFMNKVFREKGLVTRASNTSAQQRMRRNIVVGTAAVGMLAAGLFTWFGWRSLDQTIVQPSDFWTKAGETFLKYNAPAVPAQGTTEHFMPIVTQTSLGDEDFKYRGGKDDAAPLLEVPYIGDMHRTRGQFPLELKSQAAMRLDVPWVFYPIAAATGDVTGNLLAKEREDAARVLFEGSVLRPLVDAAKVRIRTDSDANTPRPWSPEATGALTQLVRLEIAGIPNAKSTMPIELEPLMRYALKGNDNFVSKGADKDLQALDEAYKALFSVSGGTWPPESMKSSNAGVIAKGFEAFNRAWTSPEASTSPNAEFGSVVRLVTALNDFGRAERALQGASTADDAAAIIADWQTRYAVLQDAAARVEKDLPALNGRSLKSAFAEELEKFRADMARQHDQILKELEPLVNSDGSLSALAKAPGGENARVDALANMHKVLVAQKDALRNDSKQITELRSTLDRLDQLYVGNPVEPVYQARMRMYKIADDRLKPGAPVGEMNPGEVRVALKAVNDAAAADAKSVQDLVRPRTSSDALATEFNEVQNAAKAATIAMLDVGASTRRGAVVQKFMADAKPGERVGDRVAAFAAAQNATVARPAVPLTARRETFNPAYAPKGAAAILGDYLAVRRELNPTSGSSGGASPRPLPGATQMRAAFDPMARNASAYLREYTAFWGPDLSREFVVEESPEGWAAFSARLKSDADPAALIKALELVQGASQNAYAELDGALDRETLDGEERKALERLHTTSDQARATLQSPAFQTTLTKVLTNWRELTVQNAAPKVLEAATGPRGVINVFIMVPDERRDADFVDKYAFDLTLKALRAVAADGGGAVRAALGDLRSAAEKFPFAPVRSGENELSATDLAGVHTAMDLLRQAGLLGRSGALAMNAGTNVEVNAELEKIAAACTPTPADAQALERMSRMLDALPGAGKVAFECEVRVLTIKPPTGGRLPVNDPSASVQISGGTNANAVGLRGGDQSLGALPYPGQPVTMKFFDAAGSQVVHTETFASAWTPLLILAKNDAQPQGGRKVWEVEVVITMQGQPCSMWVRMTFEKDLPDPLPFKR